MPIKPENRVRYPENWPEISAAARDRAGNKCEQCGLKNGAQVIRGGGKDLGTFMLYDGDGEVYDENDGRYLGLCKGSEYEVRRASVVVLTTAHLDHQPEHCEDDNLRVLCQLHHLRYDAQHHAETARATRRSRKAIGDLFEAQ